MLQMPWEEFLAAAKIDDCHLHDSGGQRPPTSPLSGATVAGITEVLGQKNLAMVKRYSLLTEQNTSKVVSPMTAKFFCK